VSNLHFPDHTVESAPEAARRTITASQRQFGYLPAAVARLATSPELLTGFLTLNGIVESSTLDALSREVVVLTMATHNGCHLCVAMHTAQLVAMETPAEVIAALRADAAPADPRLAAVRDFTLAVLAHAGAVTGAPLDAFLAQGYTPRNALEVVLGIGTYTMSTFANRMIEAPLDEPLAAYAWEPAAA
jgi:AhpD family alkylhydroperoxidase